MPFAVLLYGCASVMRINPFSGQIYQKISNTSYTITVKKCENPHTTQQILQSRMNILLLLAQDQKKTLETFCGGVDKNGNQIIGDKEFNEFTGEYLKK